MTEGQGIIIRNGSQFRDITHYVLSMTDRKEDENPHKILAIHRKAFDGPPVVSHEELSIRKNAMRRLEKPLLIGDTITWSTEDVSNDFYINKFNRDLKMFETRANNSETEICVTGAVSPTDPSHFWSKHFPNLTLGRSFYKVASANIIVTAWVILHLDDDNIFSPRFSEFGHVCEYDIQVSVHPPWLLDMPGYNQVCVAVEDEYEDLLDIGCVQTDLPLDVYGLTGLAAEKRHFYVEKYPEYKFVLPILDENITIGFFYKIDAVWNRYNKEYMITSTSVKKNLKPYSVDGTRKLRTIVRELEDVPGVFHHETMGLMDDPNGYLSLWHVSKYAKSTINVSLQLCKQSYKNFRFRICGVNQDTEKRVKQLQESTDLFLKNVCGVVISEDEVFSADHPTFLFHTNTKDVGVGDWIQFDANYDPRFKKFIITFIRPDETKDPIPFVQKRLLLRAPHLEQMVFKVKATLKSRVPLKGFPTSEAFGVLQELEDKVSENRRGPFTVWVTLSVDDLTPERTSRFMFSIISVGDKEPPNRVVATANVSRPRFGRMTNSTVSETAMSVAGSVSSCNSDLTDDERFGIPDSVHTSFSHTSPTFHQGSKGNFSSRDSYASDSRSTVTSREHGDYNPSSDYYTTTRSNTAPTPSNDMENRRMMDERSTIVNGMSQLTLDSNTVLKIISDIRRRYNHLPTCSEVCDIECEYINAIAIEIQNKDFCRQLRKNEDLLKQIRTQLGSS